MNSFLKFSVLVLIVIFSSCKKECVEILPGDHEVTFIESNDGRKTLLDLPTSTFTFTGEDMNVIFSFYEDGTFERQGNFTKVLATTVSALGQERTDTTRVTAAPLFENGTWEIIEDEN